MTEDDSLVCPAANCSETGPLSSIIHHVTTADDESHTWEALGYEHSYAFRQTHQTDPDDEPDDTEPGETQSQQATEVDKTISLEAVPGIGDTRSAAFRADGYETAADVAGADLTDIAAVSSVSQTSAKAIQAAAREECGYPETFIATLAEELDVDRAAVRDAYSPLASASVPPSAAESSLHRYFSHDDSSVMALEEWSLRYRHFLFQAGFEEIEDIATASLSELTQARYIGQTRADSIKDSAHQALETNPPTGDTAEGFEHEPKQDPESKDDPSGLGDSDRGGQTIESDEKPSTNQAPDSVDTAAGTFPEAMRDVDQWLLWKQTDDGRKIPRAPWATGDEFLYVSAMEPENWTSFESAVEWQTMLPHDFGLAFNLTAEDEFVFIDLDDVVIDGTPASAAREIIDEAETYTAVSTSGDGLHLIGRGSLSDDIKALTGPLEGDGEQSLEVYDRSHFIAMTGNHMVESPTGTTSVDDYLATLETKHASVSATKPDRATVTPTRSRSDLQDLETTDEIQDIFDAIGQTRPSDIRMDSIQTKSHSDGTYSYDPSWRHSESGTRLGVLDDVWIYRKGMIALDALQLVALEEHIITDEREYPEGEKFWEAIEALRERGAHIPTFEASASYDGESRSSTTDAEVDEEKIATHLNYGKPVRSHVHRYDRDYQERLALKVAPILAEAAETLDLSPAVAYRAAEAYAAGHAAGMVQGASHETTIGAALRIASIEAGTPRPLKTVASVLDISQKSTRRKFTRLIQDTNISGAIDNSDLVPEPTDYVPYMARQLGIHDDEAIQTQVRELLAEAEVGSGASPMSEVGAAFYTVLKAAPEHSYTQTQVGDAAGVSAVTIRNNYKKFGELL